MTTLEFPSRAIFLLLTIFLFPARNQFILVFSLINEKKEKLTLYVRWNRAPSLLVTVDGLQRHSEQRRKLLLCFSQFLPNLAEFCFFQG